MSAIPAPSEAGPRIVTGRRRAAAMARRQWGLGLAVGLIVAGLHLLGTLDWLERLTLDWRAQLFGRWSPGPSPRLAVVAIDDQAERTVGRWPWDRRRLAETIDELRRAGALVVAMDVLMVEPQAPRWAEVDQRPTGEPVLERVVDDEELAAALRAHGRVVLASSFEFAERGAAEAREGRMAAGESVAGVPFAGALARVLREPDLAALPQEEAVARLRDLLPPEERRFTEGASIEGLREAWRRAATLVWARASSSIPVAGVDALAWPESREPRPPIPTLGREAARIASVTFDSYDPDGKVRRIPLWVRQGDRLWPTLSLSAVLASWDVPLSAVRITPGATFVRMPDGTERPIPMERDAMARGDVDGLRYVTWPRARRGWVAQFHDEVNDRPAEIPIGRLLEPARLTRVVRRLTADLDRLLESELAPLWGDEDLERVLGAYRERSAVMRELAIDDPRWEELRREQAAVWTDASAAAARFVADVYPDPDALAGDEREQWAHTRRVLEAVPVLADQCAEGRRNIVEERQRLRTLVDGRICFVGWTATGAAADFVGTSIHPRTPGVHVHAAVANSLLTGYTRRPGPAWWDSTAVVALGLIGTWIGVSAGVLVAPPLLAGVVGGWFVINGVLLWDYQGTIVSAGAPAVAAIGGWLGVTLHRLLVEQRARWRTEERFRSYVSPAVVDILVSNPALDSMAPQKRELTVMFTDLAGFTTTAERLGSQRTAALLGRYLGAMTEVLQANGATLDKYLGDGIMAFWGAPIDDEDHALHACRAAIEMQRTLARLNDEGAFADAGALVMRVGIASGELMVGDFGNPPRNSSYTVLGDAANLAARLESANKYFGTRILISQRVHELLGGAMASRPIGRVVVKGKHEFEELYELIGEQQPHGPATGDWLRLTGEMVAAYQSSAFEVCLGALEKLETLFGERELARVYRESVREANGNGQAGGEFRGTIVLKEK